MVFVEILAEDDNLHTEISDVRQLILGTCIGTKFKLLLKSFSTSLLKVFLNLKSNCIFNFSSNLDKVFFQDAYYFE